MVKGSKYSVADIEQLFKPEPSQKDNIQSDEDLPMLDMDDESVELVSSYLSDRRSSGSVQPEEAAAARSREQIDSSFPMMIPTRLKTVFVVDTNFVISHLNTLEALRLLAPQFHHQIVIPSTVIQELDGLKISSSKVSVRDEFGGKRQVANLARSANDWIYRNLANLDSGIMGQKLRQTIDNTRTKDDAILDCCLYFKEKSECFVILMSNDKNLCLKALTEQVLTVSFRKGMSAQLIASKAYEENLSRFGADLVQHEPIRMNSSTVLEFHELMTTVYNEIHETVVAAVDYVMRQEYGEEIDFVEYDKEEIVTFRDISHCIVQFWVSVFCQVFQKHLRKEDWQSLPSHLMEVPTEGRRLISFVKFWSEILNYLFGKRSDQEIEQLRSLEHRWNDLIIQWS